MKIGIAVLCAGVALASARSVRAEVAAATPADEKAVAKIAIDWTDAWNRHDAEGMARVFSERGDLINPMGEAARGRPQVLKLFQTEQAGRLKQSRMALSCAPARFFGADIASVDCDFALEGVSAPPAPAISRGHITNLVVRDGDRWSVASSRAMFPWTQPKAAVTPALSH